MRTAMQLMVWYLENEGLEESGAYYKAKMLLEKEKEQIKETIFNDIQCEFLEFVNQPNYLNTLHFKVVKFISKEWFYKTKKNLSNSRTGRIRIWNSKDGENKGEGDDKNPGLKGDKNGDPKSTKY